MASKRLLPATVCLTLLLLLIGRLAGATQQIPEKIVFRGQVLKLSSKPLAAFLSPGNPEARVQTSVRSSACIRGYVGTWRIDDQFLWLVSLEDPRGHALSPTAFGASWALPSKATWYTGALLAESHVIHVSEGKVVREHEVDREHPLATLIEVRGLTVDSIADAVVGTVVKRTDRHGTVSKSPAAEFRMVQPEELAELLEAMASTRKAVPTFRGKGTVSGHTVVLRGGDSGHAGEIRFDIYDNGDGMYLQDGIGHGLNSEELAALVKRIHGPPKAMPARVKTNTIELTKSGSYASGNWTYRYIVLDKGPRKGDVQGFLKYHNRDLLDPKDANAFINTPWGWLQWTPRPRSARGNWLPVKEKLAEGRELPDPAMHPEIISNPPPTPEQP